MRKEITIDGMRFDDLPGFFDEAERVFTKDLTFAIGRNLDAFNDILRGGFGVHEYGEPITVRWIHFGKSKEDFGYDATVKYIGYLLKRCYPANVDHVQKKFDDAKQRIGQTLLDIIVEIILDHDNSGHDCILETED